MTAIRQISAVGFILAMLGPYFSILADQWIIFVHKAETQAKLASEDIHSKDLLSISFDLHIDRIHWVKPGKEFLLNGEYYDIVRKQQEGSCLHVVCYKDIKEKQLAAQLMHNTGDVNNDLKAQSLLPGFLTKIISSIQKNKAVTRYETTLIALNRSWLESHKIAPPTPPPDPAIISRY